jgi:hypothetical protein
MIGVHKSFAALADQRNICAVKQKTLNVVGLLGLSFAPRAPTFQAESQPQLQVFEAPADADLVSDLTEPER